MEGLRVEEAFEEKRSKRLDKRRAAAKAGEEAEANNGIRAKKAKTAGAKEEIAAMTTSAISTPKTPDSRTRAQASMPLPFMLEQQFAIAFSEQLMSRQKELQESSDRVYAEFFAASQVAAESNRATSEAAAKSNVNHHSG